MQKFTRSLFAVGAVLGLAACGDDVSVTPPQEPLPAIVTGVNVTPAQVTIAVGEKVILSASVTVSQGTGAPATTVTWSTNSSTIATVSAAGEVTGVAAGTTTIVATSTADNTKRGAAAVTVRAPQVTSVTVQPTALALKVGESATAVATVNRDAGAASTVTWKSSAEAIATVDATGKITAVAVGTAVITATSTADATKSGALAVTVSAQPAALNTLTVTPTVITLGPGSAQTVTTTVTTASGATVAYSNNAATAASGCPGIATASTNATSGATTITAVASGACVVTITATGSGAGLSTNSLQATVAVNVLTPQVSINSITYGATNTPVPVNNVNGQIEINLNFQPSGLPIDSVVVRMNQPDGLRRVAKQNFGGAIPAAGILTLSVNTANFVKDAAAPSVTVDLLNGPSTVSAQVYPKGATGSTAANCTNNPSDPTCASPVAIVLNNVDGWSADITKPSVNAVSAANITYWGGPTANASATVYPVIYTPGRSVSNAIWTLGGCSLDTTGVLAASNGGRTQQGRTRSFGYTANGAQEACTSYENNGGTRDNVVVASAQDNTNNTFATTPLIANTVVFNATPDSLRLDYRAPSVNTPSITRTLPAVTGWVNGAFSFINFASADNGVGLRATRDRATSYTSVNCSGVTATDVAMATGTGADINGAVACPTNFIGGTPGLGGTAPWTVKGSESDRLDNRGVSSATQTFGTDYTNPNIRWGIVGAGLPVAYGGTATDPVDTVYTVKPVAGTNEFRAEYLDDRAGFYNAGDYDAVNNVAAQSHHLSTAGHLNPTGLCSVASAGSTPGATFVTDPQCGFTRITLAVAGVRVDGWKAGQRVDVPQPEGYYGYKTWVMDAAGNTSSTIFRRTLVNAASPFSTGLGVPATLTGSTFVFNATHADSAEVIAQSLELTYPAVPTVTALRYARGSVGTAFDDVISSPLAVTISPTHGAVYARGIESTDASVFPAVNVQAYAAGTAKPTSATVWSWNVGSTKGNGVGFPAPSTSPVIPIPALNVQNGAGVQAWNVANPTIAVNHFRLIPSLATTDWFGSTTPLRAQVASPTNAPNPPFTRVDFYRLDAGGTWWNYVGSSSSAIGSDQGTYRSWIYALPNASFVNAWNTTAIQTAAATGDTFIAVGVLSNGDAIVTQVQVMP
ncbi:MAG: Ig domain-containing protein [Gemmatimonadaceae bacterium]|nr:Ig domain-containing protein [Gemmatimonadaceae bacterium]